VIEKELTHMDGEFYERTRQDFEKATKGTGMDLSMHAEGYEKKNTACAFVGWCLRIQFEQQNKPIINRG
jgi:hypothetical protein